MTHTPTPWIFKSGADNTDGDLTLGSIVGDDTHIARIWNDQEYAGQDARFIVVACNAHEELVKIAQAYRNHLKTSAHTDGEVATYQHINDLLNTIEKGT